VIPNVHTLWAAALLLSLAGNLWLVLTRAQVQRDAAQVQTALAQERADRERERADAAVALATATEQARQTEAQWRAKHQEVQTHAQTQVRAAQAAAARARDAADSLQRRVETVAAQCAHPTRDSAAPDPGFAPGGAPARDPGTVLANLLRGLTQAAGELAAVADARGAAGVACERSYDAMTSPRKP
jgi:hypothetical protein